MRRKSSALYRKRKHEAEYENMLNILLLRKFMTRGTGLRSREKRHISFLPRCFLFSVRMRGAEIAFEKVRQKVEKREGGFILSSNVDINMGRGAYMVIYVKHDNNFQNSRISCQ